MITRRYPAIACAIAFLSSLSIGTEQHGHAPPLTSSDVKLDDSPIAKELRQAVEGFEGNVAILVPKKLKSIGKLYGPKLIRMKTLGKKVGARYEWIANTHVVYRPQEPITDILKHPTLDSGIMLDWLQGLSSEELQRAMNGRYMTSEMTYRKRLEFLSRFANDDALQQTFMVRNSEVSISVGLCIRFDVTDAKTGQSRPYMTPSNARPNPRFDESFSSEIPLKMQELPIEDVPSSGTLIFEKGELMTLFDLAGKVGKKFGSKYRTDERIADTLCFVKGRYSQDQVEEVIGKLSSVPRVQPASSFSEELNRMMTQLLATHPVLTQKAAHGASAELMAIAKRKGTISFDEACVQSSWFNLARQKLPIDPKSKVRVSLAIEMTLDAGGIRQSDGRVATSNAVGFIGP